MYVTTHMTTPPVTIVAGTEMAIAKKLLCENNFRHLPVVDEGGVLVGMITDRDIRSAYPSTAVPEANHTAEMTKIDTTPVQAIMSSEVVTLNKYSTLDDALLILDAKKIGAIPVVDDKKVVVGIFSIRDMLKAYRRLFGLGELGGALVAVKPDGKERPLTRISHILEEHNIHFSRLVRCKDEDRPGEETIYIRVNTMNIHAVHEILHNAGFTIDLLLPNQV